MPRTITVKGIGKVSAAPDFVVLSMGLESQDTLQTILSKNSL